jgi:putative transcriptional regulator
MLDPKFDATVVYLYETAEGAAGVVVNRPTDIPVSDVLPTLAEGAVSPAVVFHGGPVGVEHALIIGVADGAINLMDLETAARADSVRVFAGYAGWEHGQLELEIAEGAWFLASSTSEDILTPEPAELWRNVYGRQDGLIRRYRNYPDDPRLN